MDSVIIGTYIVCAFVAIYFIGCFIKDVFFCE